MAFCADILLNTTNFRDRTNRPTQPKTMEMLQMIIMTWLNAQTKPNI